MTDARRLPPPRSGRRRHSAERRCVEEKRRSPRQSYRNHITDNSVSTDERGHARNGHGVAPRGATESPHNESGPFYDCGSGGCLWHPERRSSKKEVVRARSETQSFRQCEQSVLFRACRRSSVLTLFFFRKPTAGSPMVSCRRPRMRPECRSRRAPRSRASRLSHHRGERVSTRLARR
jgi:hypothetical protein